MSDLVKRLRAPMGVMKCEVSNGPPPENRLERRWLLALEAAARIEALENALRAVDDEHGYGLPPETRQMIRAALEDKA